MSEEKGNTAADQKALALNVAMTALVRSLVMQNHLDIDLYLSQLGSARQRLEQLEETEAAALLGGFAESLQAT
ncbi:hypothetical protein [Thalassospira sp. MCCC 1A01428]|uniref:hypothetical protein n=1 Tax=Thalassospira sp. MCCC 1A01428 TaxID=1470575 RepID=UPI000A1EBFB0|nr:hypothetical protein [Thalassospira sp. MCCC 1A01428]OSQ45568.1 hypothetical protein THS27_04370 [Thalassospira sp. MCCC 1A01428]